MDQHHLDRTGTGHNILSDSQHYFSFFKHNFGGGKMTQQLRSPAVFPEVPGLVSSTHVKWLTASCNPVPGDLTFS